MLLYLLLAYITVFTFALWQTERLHNKRTCITGGNDKEDAQEQYDFIIIRVLYLTLPVCYYITLFYFGYYIISEVVAQRG